ncbi:Hypothetical predicted protein [Octopus vulgaris]|uniref:Uncharacterized protein n=2 Tax=Octopus TaxID=6643 RepID=A0AA36AL48_OCTVU|nr:uncharacterized protein LOC115232540 isoform X1 [Octopus sinensis]CAI9718200.1 Hypothetical predicted protein [Octopus vulgaris]
MESKTILSGLSLLSALLIVCLAGAVYAEFSEDDDISEETAVDKRWARLSSNPWYTYRRNTFGDLLKRWGWAGRSSHPWMHMPWMLLPNRMCLRQRCRSNNDCCRRYNICDRWAKLCYDCWYGHPCSSDKDCCQRYPRCSLSKGTCTN